MSVLDLRLACDPRRWRLPLLGLVLAGGCGSGLEGFADGDTDASRVPVATLLGEIDPNHFCNMVGVEHIGIRAEPVECAVPEVGCALPDAVDGDMVTCPAVDPQVLLGVEVDQAAQYRVVVAASLTTGEALVECFAGDGGAVLTVSQAQIDASAQIALSGLPGSCPEN